jgi:hypothetical protein
MKISFFLSVSISTFSHGCVGAKKISSQILGLLLPVIMNWKKIINITAIRRVIIKDEIIIHQTPI